jgi:hypothetical protein
MKVFISYAREQRQIATEVSAAVSVRGHDVFFDLSNLKAGKQYDVEIQQAIQGCDLFVFLISPASLTEGKYVLTELGFAMQKWKNPSGKVLPVMVQPTIISRVPPYLRAVTILYPQGNLPAEVSANVDALLMRTERPTDLVADGIITRLKFGQSPHEQVSRHKHT